MESDSVLLVAQLVGGVAGLLATVAWIWIVVIAFSEDIVSGLLCLICGPYSIYYAITRWEDCKTPFLACVAFWILGMAGNGLVAKNMVEKEGVDIWDTLASKFQSESSMALNSELIQADKHRLQGRWIVNSSGGKETFELEDDQCRITRSGREELFIFELVAVDGYRAIDLRSVISGKVTRGIYVLENERFKVALGKPDDERPTQFKAVEKTQELFVLHRPWS